jgi:c-di-GMP-binding flagellar brake protein YcgR
MARPKTEEKRRHRRYDVEGVKGSLRLSMDATILNLSVDGMALETHSWLSVGRKYSFKLRRDPEGDIPLTGEVVWCNLVRTARDSRGETLPVYRAGVRFDDVLSETAREVRTFIEQNAVVRLDTTRLFGRFRVPDRGADVALEQSFEVRRMSFSGMLIVADFVPDLEARFRIELQSGEDPVAVEVRVAHVKELEDPDEGRAEIGVEFLDLTPEAHQALKILIGHGPEDETG